MATLENLVRQYELYERSRINRMLNFYKLSLQNNNLLVDQSVKGILPNGKRDKHQRRISKNAIKRVAFNLKQNSGQFQKCKHFDDIFGIVYSNKVKGFASLSVYDTSLRIGYCYNLLPDVIYLHTGALEGAVALLGNKIRQQFLFFNNDKNYPYLYKSSFPNELTILKPYEIECFLCIFKDKIKKLKKA